MRSAADAGDLAGSGAQGSTRSGTGLAHSPDSADARADAGRAGAAASGATVDVPRAAIELSQGSVGSRFRSSIHSTCTRAWVRGVGEGVVEDVDAHGSTTQSDCANATPAPAKLADTTKMLTRISKRVAQNPSSSTRRIVGSIDLDVPAGQWGS